MQPHLDPGRIRLRRARADRVAVRRDAVADPGAGRTLRRKLPARGMLLATSVRASGWPMLGGAWFGRSVTGVVRRLGWCRRGGGGGGACCCGGVGGAGGASRNVVRARSASGSVGTPCEGPASSGSSVVSGAFDGTKSAGRGRPGIDGGSGGFRRVGRVSRFEVDPSDPSSRALYARCRLGRARLDFLRNSHKGTFRPCSSIDYNPSGLHDPSAIGRKLQVANSFGKTPALGETAVECRRADTENFPGIAAHRACHTSTVRIHWRVRQETFPQLQ